MRVMVIVKATADSEAGKMPTAELMAAMGDFNKQLLEAGIMKAAEGLTASSAGKRVQFDGPKRSVIDGPFAETKELAAGFWLWEVKDLEEAVEWVKKCPNPMAGPSEIEIRPILSFEDFADIVSPEHMERQRNFRAQQAGG